LTLREQAFALYAEHHGAIKIKEIASQISLPDGTVRGWKSKDKWDEKINGTFPLTVERSKIKRNDTKASASKKTVEDIAVCNPTLTERQRLFCLYYIKSFNATTSAIKAGYAKDAAHVGGSRLIRNTKVAAEIRRLKGKIADELFIDAMDVLQRYIKIAFADMTDFVDFGTQDQPLTNSDGGVVLDDSGNPVTAQHNYVNIKNHTEVDGGLINEIKMGQHGVSIKLEDRQKALDKLAIYFDLFPDNVKRKVENERLKLEQQKLDLLKRKSGDDENVIEESNKRLITLADLLNNAVQDRYVQDFEDEEEK
jgi:phage terminase small subunit